MIIGKYEFIALLIFGFLIFLELINKPLCAVCFFDKTSKEFIEFPKGSTIEALIVSEPEVGYKSQRFQVEWESKKMLVVANRYQRLRYGDVVAIKGVIGKPENFGTFGLPGIVHYQAYLLRQNIVGVAYYPTITVFASGKGNYFFERIYALKEVLRRPILENLPEPHASFIISMTLGDDWRIPPDFLEALRQSGTIHIISISGFHMAVVAALVFILFIALGLKRTWATLATFFILVIYIAMVGFSSAAIRAGLMGMLLLVGFLLGRLQKLLYAILVSAIAMTLWDNELLYDVGFQLSFGAMAGLAVFYSRFKEWFLRLPVASLIPFKEIIPASFAANVAIFPILAYHFGQVSFISPVSNFFILPIVPFLMILGFVAELSGWFISPLWLILEYSIRIITFFGSL